MSKDKISDYSATANSNTDIGGINIDEGCAPSGINDAIRTLMKQLKDWQSGSQDVYIHPSGSASVPSITATGDTNTGLFFPAADTIALTTGGTERLRLDSSGNLGLGTSSPVQKQHLDGGAGDTYLQFSNSTTGATSSDGSRIGIASADTTLRIQNLESGSIRFDTAGSERMRIDSSGNLGLGVTPSAWASTFKVLQFKNGVYYGQYDGGSIPSGYFGTNNYFNGTNFIYVASEYATRYQQEQGKHMFYTAASGTAGGTVSFTQAMTLSADGNLGIGTTSPGSYRFYVKTATDKTAATGYPFILSSSDANPFDLIIERKSNSYYKFQAVEQGIAYRDIAMQTDGGNLLVGKTSTDDTIVGIKFGAVSEGSVITAGSGFSWGFMVNRQSDNGDAIRFRRTNSNVGSISVTTTATAYNTSSDHRLKENIQPMTGALAKVAALKPCTYTWKSDGSAGEGFIAHELQAVVPDAVTGEKDAVDADGNPIYQGIDTSFLVATLTAALQELKAEFDAYKATHP